MFPELELNNEFQLVSKKENNDIHKVRNFAAQKLKIELDE